jgi:hypothetical protein
MDPNYTDITLIWDRSGSMRAMKSEPIGAFNAFIEEQKKGEGKCLVTLILFDHEYVFAHRAVPIDKVVPLTKRTYIPRGTTALYDALGRAISEAGGRFAGMPENERPSKVIFATLTDGLENASKEWAGAQVKEAIETQTEKFNWSFVYLGTDVSQIQEQGERIGTLSANMVSYNQAKAGDLELKVRRMSGRVATYRATGAGGQSLGG